MKKKILTVILVLALTLSISVPAFAASYSDLEGHWAREYMEDLTDRGFLSGYGDGTMMPDKNITACETLALLSRFYSPDSSAMELIDEDYGKYVSETVPTSLSWAYDELEICLAAGIITKDETKSISLSAEIKKEQLSLFLGRAIQLTSEANKLADSELTFDDADEITDAYIGYVAALVSAGIVSGDNNNDFCPNLSVTRAVTATMISRAINYLHTNGKTLAIEAYDGAASTLGVISAVSGSALDLNCFDGCTREYPVSSTASVTVNGTEKALSSIYVGCYAKVLSVDGTATRLVIESGSSVEWVQGMVYSTYPSSSSDSIYVEDPDSGSTTKYTVPNDADITKDGSTVDFSYIVVGSFVTLKLENGVVTEVRAVSGDNEATGSITEISYGTTVTLKVEGENGIVFRFLLDISDLPKILRNNTLISIDRLKAGDEVAITSEDCEIASIAVKGDENTITGELTSITTTASGTKWDIETSDGTVKTLDVDENAGVYSDNTAILLSGIHVDDTVSVVVYGSTITEINLESSSASTSKVAGTVLTMNTATKVITLLTSSNKLVYINASSVASIIFASTGKATYISVIKADDELVAYGEYTDSTNFNSVSIIIGG